MSFGSEAELAWLVGIATLIFAVFVLARFNRRKLGALWERWDNAPWHAHAFTNSAVFGLFAAGWRAVGRELEFWVLSFFAALYLAQGVYCFLNRNKPVDNSFATERRRAMLRAVYSLALFLPLAWVAVQTARGVEFESTVWALGLGAAFGGAIGILDSVRKWRTLEADPTRQSA